MKRQVTLKNFLTHDDLTNGAKINFIMSQTPGKGRGTDKADFPYSFSNDKKNVKEAMRSSNLDF